MRKQLFVACALMASSINSFKGQTMKKRQIQKLIRLLSDANDNKPEVIYLLKKQLKNDDDIAQKMYPIFRQLSYSHANIRTLHTAIKNGELPNWAILDSLECIDNIMFDQLGLIFKLFDGGKK